MLTKPVFCLPLPFGSEETDVKTPQVYVDFFHQPVIHLGGTRFPSLLYPVSPLDGIEEYLPTHLPYSIALYISAVLIDAGNHLGRCILPWNDKKECACLDDLFRYAFNSLNLQEMQNRFWKNLKTVFIDQSPKELWEGMERLGTQDAQLYFELGKALCEHQNRSVDPVFEAKNEIESRFNINIEDTHYTKCLLLIAHCVCSFSEMNYKKLFRKTNGLSGFIG